MSRRGATLELAVLGLLHEQPMHGYELRKRLAGVLGASPGASTAVPIALDILRTSFKDEWSTWENELRSVMPTLGTDMKAEPEKALELEAEADVTLGLPKRV